VSPARRLGQHFLTDRNLLRRIVDALEPAPGDVVLEIGPGKGSLTAELLARGVQVVAIEKDERLAAALERGRVGGATPGSFRVVTGDALALDWHALVTAAGAMRPGSRVPVFKVIGNIPYAITSPLIATALVPPLPSRIVLLVQREVAERLAAAPGSKTYGALSVGVQAVCQVEQLFTVRAGAFSPPPTVQSAVVRLTPRATPLVQSAELAALRTFVAACFSRRRKQLRNVLIAATGQSAERVVEGLRVLGLDPAARPETLAPETFVRLLRWSASLVKTRTT
jgi:16S rRNA (adenine1518-N6/adenine1519-N6)-dimethyltransferase